MTDSFERNHIVLIEAKLPLGGSSCSEVSSQPNPASDLCAVRVHYSSQAAHSLCFTAGNGHDAGVFSFRWLGEMINFIHSCKRVRRVYCPCCIHSK